jgi:ABC-type transport system involved in cytochrome c biogenesis permease subunit
VTRYLIVFGLGGLVGGPLWIRIGRHHARALRASRDLLATKQAITGLARKTFDEWARVFRAAGVIVIVGIVVVAMVVGGGGR